MSDKNLEVVELINANQEQVSIPVASEATTPDWQNKAIEYKNQMLSTAKFPPNTDLDLSKDFSKTTYNPESAIIPLPVDKAGSVDVGVSDYVSKSQGEAKAVVTESTPSPNENGTKPTDNKTPDSQKKESPNKASNAHKQNKSSPAKKTSPRTDPKKESNVDKETKGEPQKKKGEKRKENPDNDRSLVNVTEKNDQNVTNSNQSYGFANLNFNGSSARGQARKNNADKTNKQSIPNPSEKMNQIIDLVTELEQANIDLGHAIDTGAPASELKKHTKKFESTAQKLNTKYSSLSKKLDTLSPSAKSQIAQMVSPAKLESLGKKTESAYMILSKDNLSNIGMTGSSKLKKISPDLSKSMEKMQQSLKDITSTIMNSLSIGR